MIYWQRLQGWAERLATTEAILGAFIVLAWAVLATIGSAPPLVVVLIIGFSLVLHSSAVDTGNHSVLWITTGWLLLLIVATTRSTLEGAGPLALAVAGLTALGHNELVRVGHARRRNAEIDDEVLVGSAVGLGIVGLVALIGIAVAEPFTRGEDRSWLWMPVAVLGVVVVGILFTALPAWRAPDASKHRWRPGDRIPPRRFDREPDEA